jgi:hypothetical protein
VPDRLSGYRCAPRPNEEIVVSQFVDGITTLQSNPDCVQNDECLVEQLISQIQAGHESAACQLREFLARGVRWYLKRGGAKMGIEAGTRQVLDKVLQGIRDYRVANMAELTSLTRSEVIAIANQPRAASRKEIPVDRQSVESMKRALQELDSFERDALVRYFEGQPSDGICADLGIDVTFLEALRVRVRSRCAELRSRN